MPNALNQSQSNDLDDWILFLHAILAKFINRVHYCWSFCSVDLNLKTFNLYLLVLL